MKQHLPPTSKSAGHWILYFFSQFPGLIGCITAIVIASCGRFLFSITTLSLSGWTALFFLALSVGLMVVCYFGNAWRTSGARWLGMLFGSSASLTALICYQYSMGSAADALLLVGGILLFTSLPRAKYQKPAVDLTPDNLPIRWSHRLDALLKYNLGYELRGRVIALIDQLWSSPDKQTDFIPFQNQQFDDLLCELESSLRSNNPLQAQEILAEMTTCLDKRNALLVHPVAIEYRDLGKTNRSLGKQADSASLLKKL